MKENNKARRIVMAAMLAALTCVATMVIKIPSPLQGYVNLGDCAVLFAGWVLDPVYGFLAAGLGSALADLFSGYAVYAPATFFIKGGMAFVAFCGFRLFCKKLGSLPARIFAGILAETVMVLGYFVFEGFLYGFGPSALNVPANLVQGVVGLVLGCILGKVFEKSKRISFR